VTIDRDWWYGDSKNAPRSKTYERWGKSFYRDGKWWHRRQTVHVSETWAALTINRTAEQEAIVVKELRNRTEEIKALMRRKE
jgi:hypothetical protein